MGHDIYGYNKAGESIAYARFSMQNYNAYILYDILNAQEYNGGVSGIGGSLTLSKKAMEKAWKDYEQLFSSENDHFTEDKFLLWDKKQIREFMINCLAEAKKEGRVVVFFG